MDFVEFLGKTTEDALAQAGDHFNLPIDRLEVEVVSAGSTGMFGLIGRKKAVVKARPRDSKSVEEEVAQLVSVVSSAGQEPARKPRPVAPKPEPPKPAAAPRAPRPEPAPKPAAAAPRPEPKPEPRPAPQPRPREQATAKPEPTRPAQPAPPKEKAPVATGAIPKEDRPSPELMIKAEEGLAKMALALDSTAKVSVGNGEEGIELTIDGGDPGVFIGRRGQTLDALQYLVTRMVSQAAGKSVRVVVDAGGYRARRRDSLKEMALKLAEKTENSGHPVSTGPLNAQDRRVVHLCLKEKNGIHTVSRGRGEMKKVVISARR